MRQFCHVSIPWSSVSKARGFFGWFFLVAICSFCCLRSHFLLKVETPRMTSGFPPMKICWSRYKLWTTRHRTCLLISFHTVSNGIMTSHALICGSRFSYFLTLFPSVNIINFEYIYFVENNFHSPTKYWNQLLRKYFYVI